MPFSGCISYWFWLLCYFFPYITEKKCNNELGLLHQDGGNMSMSNLLLGIEKNIFIHVLLSI